MRVWGLFVIFLPFHTAGHDTSISCGCSTPNIVNCAPEIRILEPHQLKESNPSDIKWTNEPIIAYKNTRIVIECNCMDPIQWITDSKHPHTNDLLEIRQERSFGDFRNASTYCYKTTLTVISMNKDFIGKYICQSTENTDKLSSFQLYLSDKEDLAKPFYLQAGTSLHVSTHKLEYKLMIPCPVSCPSSNFYLQKYNGREFQNVAVDIDFIPYAGFELTNREEKSLEGKYRCVLKNQENYPSSFVQIDVINADFYYFPRVSTIFTKDSLTVKCSSTGPVKLEMDQQKGLKAHNVTYVIEPMTIYPYTAILDYQFREHSPREGTIKCVQEKSLHVLNEWKYQKIDKENGITFDHENNLIFCKSSHFYESPSVSLKFCPSVELCHLYRKFLHSKNYTNTEDLKTSTCGSNCQKVSVTDFTTIGSYVIRCHFAKFTFLQTFFIGLDRNLYTTIDSAPTKALIQIEGVQEQTLNDEKKISAQCKWLTNFAADLNVWLLERKNGQKEIIDKNFSKNHEDRGVLVSILEYPVAKNYFDIQGIHCYVGMRNSSGWIYSSHNFSGQETDVSRVLTDSKSIGWNLLSTMYNIEDASCPAQNFDNENIALQFDSFCNKRIIFPLIFISVVTAVNSLALFYMVYMQIRKK